MEEQLYELMRQCTVRVSVPKVESGTGFFVAPGLIVTCAHVVKAAQANTSSVEMYWNGQSHPAQITKFLPDSDLALLQVNLTDHPCVYLGEEAIPFDELYSYGYPDNHLDGDPATFALEGRAGEQGEQLKFKIGQVRPGMSGAPILNERTGYVCGIVQISRDRDNDLGGRGIPTTTVFHAVPDIVALQQQFHQQDRRWMKCLEETFPFSQRPTVPFMVADKPPDFVARPREFEALKQSILDGRRDLSTAIIVALCGAGGYGKTTLALALCHAPDIRNAFRDGILWVSLGESMTSDKLVPRVNDLIYTLSHEQHGFAGLDAATNRLVELLDDHDMLIVIDDVWNVAHLSPFIQGGKRCARLITTRDDAMLLHLNAQRVAVDAMQGDEAVQLLSVGIDNVALSTSDREALSSLAKRLGEWPLLLKLANGVLRERVNTYKQPLSDAMTYVNKALDKRGLTAFDENNPQDRSQAVERTLGVSFELLSRDQYARYRELAIFSAEVNIPLVTLQKLWGATGKLDDFDTDDLCRRLHSLSLLLSFDLNARTVRLHDVVLAYLRSEVGKEGLVALHRQFLDAYGIQRWAELSHEEPYLWDHLAGHLIDAGRSDELVATVQDGHYLVAKINARSAYALETDLNTAEQQAPADITLHLLQRNIARISHLFAHCQTRGEVAVVLYGRLVYLQQMSAVCAALEQELPRVYLIPWHPLPDLKLSALIRTLQSHKDDVWGCAVSPAGDFIVSASRDNTLKVWDAQTGAERLTLTGHSDSVWGCAVGPAGGFIVSTSRDDTLKVWDAQTGAEQFTLTGHTNWVNGCAVSPAGDFIVSASHDETLKVWDARTGVERLTLTGHQAAVWGCAVGPAGDFIVSASADKTLKVWDAHTGTERLTLTGHKDAVNGCAVSPAGDFIVSASADKTLKVWDAQTGAERLALAGHSDAVWGCAIGPNGDFIVSASNDNTLKLWNVQTGSERLTLTDHISAVNACAVSPAGDFIVSASNDNTLKVWDAWTEAEQFTLTGHTDWVNACAVSPAGDFIVSASDDSTLKVWNARTGAEQFTLTGHSDGVIGCAVGPASDIIVSASADKTLKLWDARTGAERFTLTGHSAAVNGCAINSTGDIIVSASADKTLKFWNARTGAEKFTLIGHSDAVWGCAVSPASDIIVSASADKKLKVWDIQTRAERFTLTGHTDEVTWCAIGPKGDFIVSASRDKTLKLWDIQTRAEQLTLTGHSDAVWGCAISRAGDLIVSASDDRTLKLWDAHTGNCLTTLPVDGFLKACAFCPDGKHIVALGEDGVYFLQLVD